MVKDLKTHHTPHTQFDPPKPNKHIQTYSYLYMYIIQNPETIIHGNIVLALGNRINRTEQK